LATAWLRDIGPLTLNLVFGAIPKHQAAPDYSIFVYGCKGRKATCWVPTSPPTEAPQVCRRSSMGRQAKLADVKKQRTAHGPPKSSPHFRVCTSHQTCPSAGGTSWTKGCPI